MQASRLTSRLQQWIFRLGRDETLPIVLGQRRIFILPTGAGYLFAVVLAVMLLGAINYTLSLGHALIGLALHWSGGERKREANAGEAADARA